MQGLQQLGWVEGRNVRIDYRWAAGERALFASFAAELIALGPEAVLASTTQSVQALQQTNGDVSIVFVSTTTLLGLGS